MIFRLSIDRKKWSEFELAEFIEKLETEKRKLKDCLKKETKGERSCFTCTHKLCHIFHGVKKAISYHPFNIDSDSAPGRWCEIFDALGNACLEYREGE